MENENVEKDYSHRTVSRAKNLINNSGKGPGTPVLNVVSKKFNWGAFYFTFIWGIANKTYITFVPLCISIFFMILMQTANAANSAILNILNYIICLAFNIWFGIKGNTWAWQNKRWKSIGHFHDVQKKWAIAVIVVILACTLLSLLISFILLNFFGLPAGLGGLRGLG